MNLWTIIDTQSWCKILPLNGCNLIHENEKSLRKFLKPTEKLKVIYTDNSQEFVKSCEDLSWNHRTSTPHRSDTNGIAERAVRRPKEGTSAVLLQSGLDEKWWADSKVEISLPFRAASLEQSAVREEPLRWEIHCWQCPMRYELIGRPIRILGGTSTAGFGEWVYFLDNMWDPGWREARLLMFYWQGSLCNPQQVLPESWSANLCFCAHTSTRPFQSIWKWGWSCLIGKGNQRHPQHHQSNVPWGAVIW